MTLTELLAPTYKHMLQALSGWLKKARDAGADTDALMAARLAPDMFPLATQGRCACVQAHEGAYRLRGAARPPVIDALHKEGVDGGDTPGTMVAALARIDEALAVLEGQPADALDAGAKQPLGLELPVGLAFDFDGEHYVRDWALPQFYFHMNMAYAILRNQGVEIGKADYVPHMFAYLRPGTGPSS
jgi:hypothetical protein